MSEWISIGQGLQYRKHKSRKHGVRFDRYFRGRYTVSGKTVTVGFGWESEGWNQDKCYKELVAFKEAAKTGQGSQTLSEKRKTEDDRRKAEQVEREQKTREGITFADFFKDTYAPILETTKKTGSVKAEGILFKKWIDPVIGHMPFKNIFPLHLERLRKNMLEAGKSPRSIEYTFAVIRQCWNMAHRDGLIDRESPTKQIKKLKFDNKRVRFLSHDEAQALLENLLGRSKQLHDMALLSLHSGLRALEIFSLKWGNLDLENSLIHILDSKGGSRTGYVTETIQRMFADMGRGKPDELVFKDRRHGGIIKQISSSFDRSVKTLGLNNGVTDPRQKVLFHSLRHTFASWLVQAGTPLYTVQRLMGHASIAMTERYSHLAPDTLKNAIRSFEKNLNSNGKQKIIALHE